MSSRDHPDWWRPMGGQNSQDSILERRSLVWNDNGVLNGVAPPAFYTCEEYKGKFFPRGCRGMIEAIHIYCRDAGADRLTLRYSPHPCLGPFGEVTITPLAGWSWVAAVIEEMWDYDSLFIWVVECDQGTDWAYDAVEPYDGHWSSDTGATWEDLAIRPFIRVVYTGETPGDVPVSGILNVIPLPNRSSVREVEDVNVPANVNTLLIQAEGAGDVDFVIFYVHAAAGSHNTFIRIYCEGAAAFSFRPVDLNLLGFTNTTNVINLSQYLENGVCVVTVEKPFSFRRSFSMRAFNAVNPQTVTAWAFPNLLR